MDGQILDTMNLVQATDTCSFSRTWQNSQNVHSESEMSLSYDHLMLINRKRMRLDLHLQVEIGWFKV